MNSNTTQQDFHGNSSGYDDNPYTDYNDLIHVTRSTWLLNWNRQGEATNWSNQLQPGTNQDLLFWTPYQRFQLKQIPRSLHVSLGVILALVSLFGIISNITILYVFSRFKRLRTPANVFIINLTISDLGACFIHPMSIYSAFNGGWSFGHLGCSLYAMGVGFFGLNTIVTLSAIACERYIVITSQPAVAKWKMTRRQARKACVGIWLHCAALVTPPLFGWSSYQTEGLLISCSWDYKSRSFYNRLYYIYLLVFGFALPILVLTFCYATIFRFLLSHTREMTMLTVSSQKTSFRKTRKKTDIRTAQIIMTLALFFCLAWMPYAIVSLIGQFGPEDEDLLSPIATTIPAFFAKTSIVVDPIVYGFSHPQFRSSVRQMFHSFSTSNMHMAYPAGDTQTFNGGRSSHIRKDNVSYSLQVPQFNSGRRHRIQRNHYKCSDRCKPSVNDSACSKSWAQHSVTFFPQQSEIILFRNQRKRSLDRIKRQRRIQLLAPSNTHQSEPDLMRCSQLVDGAAAMSWSEYRKKKRQMLYKVLFSSASQLERCEFAAERSPAASPDCRSTSSHSRELREVASNAHLQPARFDGGVSVAIMNRLTARPTPSSGGEEKRSKPSYYRRRVHLENCCECAHQSLNETITVAHSRSTIGDRTNNRSSSVGFSSRKNWSVTH